jgi:hypothetical protein
MVYVTIQLSLLYSTGEGGLYCSGFRNSLAFCHIARNTCIFCRLWPSLSSPISLTSASQSLQWTSKVPKKSNMSNKPVLLCPVSDKGFWGAREEAAYYGSSH